MPNAAIQLVFMNMIAARKFSVTRPRFDAIL